MRQPPGTDLKWRPLTSGTSASASGRQTNGRGRRRRSGRGGGSEEEEKLCLAGMPEMVGA